MDTAQRLRIQPRRRPMRQWLGIELAAYALLLPLLATQAWINNHGSPLVLLALWVPLGGALALAVRGARRRRVRIPVRDRPDTPR